MGQNTPDWKEYIMENLAVLLRSDVPGAYSRPCASSENIIVPALQPV